MIKTRQLSGRAKSRFLRETVEQTGASPDVTTKLDGAIVSVLVRGHQAGGLGVNRSKGPRRARPMVSSVEAVCARPPTASPPPAPPHLRKVEESPVPPLVPFNPYGFSAMAVLLNEGRPALEALLAQVTTKEQIVQLADAQSVRLDPAVAGNKKSSLKAMRAAFADAVEKRVAHRRAVSG